MYVRRKASRLKKIRVFIAEEIAPYFRYRGKKPLGRQIAEMWELWREYRMIPYQYVKLGLYSERFAHGVSDYVPPLLIYRLQGALNAGRSEAAQIGSDKLRFRRRMEAHGLPVVREIVSIDREGTIRDAEGQALAAAEAVGRLRDHPGRLFVKPIDGIFGDEARPLDPAAADAAFLGRQRNVLIQPRIRQHPEIDAIYAGAINTVRIDTLLTEAGCQHDAAMLRLGAGGSVIDNAGAGGLAVGIDLATGALFPLARSRARYGLREFAAHPDTGTVFAGRRIPFWREVRALAVRAAEAMRPLGSLGWDVVITPEGPVLLEVNFNWGVNAMQTACGGLGRTPIGRLARRHHGLPDRPGPVSSAAAGAPAA
jgi:hypothetical protein